MNKLSHPKRHQQKPKPKPQPRESKCKFCCKVHPWINEHFPTCGKTCYKCEEKNHAQSKCPSSEQQKQRLQKVHQLQAQEESTSDLSSDESNYIDAVTSSGLCNEVKCWMLMSSGTEVIFQVDTGSTVNVLPARFHSSDMPLNPVKKTLHAWNEGKVTALGMYWHTLRNPLTRKKYSIDFVIVKENFTPILGLKASTALKFVTINDDTFDQVPSIKEDHYQEIINRKLGIILG